MLLSITSMISIMLRDRWVKGRTVREIMLNSTIAVAVSVYHEGR